LGEIKTSIFVLELIAPKTEYEVEHLLDFVTGLEGSCDDFA
jgi:hypothetical protein